LNRDRIASRFGSFFETGHVSLISSPPRSAFVGEGKSGTTPLSRCGAGRFRIVRASGFTKSAQRLDRPSIYRFFN
jgi:hypothetical protein